MISISVQGHHCSEVDDNDLQRAREAANAALTVAGVSASDAAAAYRSQWAEYDDESKMHGAALAWIEAAKAADVAVTDGWANPAAEVFCELSA
jgi:hypothetical protein